MPNSNLSGYSTASKHEIAKINAEMARKDAENAKKDSLNAAQLARKDAEMNQIQVQMAEMAKIINNMQQAPNGSFVTPTAPSRGGGGSRGRGQNSARGGHVGRGAGRGRGRGVIPPQALDSFESSQSSKMFSRSESKKKGCEDLEILETSTEKGKFWLESAISPDPDGGDDSEQDDPRNDEDWKIQRRKGFMKDRECLYSMLI